VIKLDKYSRRLIEEVDIINTLYNNPNIDLSKLYLVDPEKHNQAIKTNFSELNLISKLENLTVDILEYHSMNRNEWFMPDDYKTLDIAAWVLKQCNNNEVELQRCGQELLEYAARDLLPLLQYLKYLVDTMKQNNIVWGVGRGSSTASFVLYKMGVHRINSIEYQLPLEEFFKELIVN
jgi:hypothetical protein